MSKEKSRPKRTVRLISEGDADSRLRRAWIDLRLAAFSCHFLFREDPFEKAINEMATKKRIDLETQAMIGIPGGIL